MNDSLKHLRKLSEARYKGKELLQEIEQTLAELEIYLEANPDDEIALVQYRQYSVKRAGYLTQPLNSTHSAIDSEIQV